MTKRPPEVDPGHLFEFFGHHGASLDELSEGLQELYDEGRRSLPPEVEEWHRLTGVMIKQYDLQRPIRESQAMQHRNAGRGLGIKEVSGTPDEPE